MMESTIFPHYPVLYVGDPDQFIETIGKVLHDDGINNVAVCPAIADIEAYLARARHSVVIIDHDLPPAEGMQLIDSITDSYPSVATIVISSNPDVETVVDYMKRGVYDYLLRPINVNRLILSIRKLAKKSQELAPKADDTDTGIVFREQLPTLKQTEFLLINESLRRSKGNRSLAARILGVTQQVLDSRLRTTDRPDEDTAS